jgi:O-6-methylguanine DNA methyltransferase
MSSMYFDTVESPIGPLRLAATHKGLCLVEFEEAGSRHDPAGIASAFQCRRAPGSNDQLRQAVEEMEAYLAGELQSFRVSLDQRGTPFQLSVWRGLQSIPYGQTISYGELAHRIGYPTAQRAVGRANAQNPIPIVVPCHRVISASGRLHGFGGGLWRKQFLLDLERAMAPIGVD